MTIIAKPFDNEQELHKWVERNISTFFGDVYYLPGEFFITTKRDKGAKPDGFVLDLKNGTWTIIESELLKHGVWDHIAEQIIRFIVACQNSATKRKIRDYFFERFERDGLISKISKELSVSEARLLRVIESILENNLPDIALFIDDVNEDLQDVVEALNATMRVFRIQKYAVNGSIEYHPTEGNKSVIETSVEDVKDVQGKPNDVLELLGGGRPIGNLGRVNIYQMTNGDKIAIKVSKLYDDDPPYWYGVTPETLKKYEEQKVTHIAFVLGQEGVLNVPFSVVREYLSNANTSLNSDETVRHFHVFIKNDPKRIFYINQQKPTWDLEKYFYPFE